jgi:hypothetical protein
MSNRIGRVWCRWNLFGRFYGGRNEIPCMHRPTDVFRLAWVDLPRIRARFSTCLDTRIGSGSQSAFSLKERQACSTNTTVFSVLWPTSIALWGSLVPPYTLAVQLEAYNVPELSISVKMVGLPIPNVLTMGSPHTKPPPYDFLNLYGACLQAPGTLKMK